jgi:vacuolar-type H+-ATPase subunit H
VGKTPAKPRRSGRPKLPQASRAPHRPVLTMRVSAEVYAQTVEAARQANRKITEEAGYRLERSFVWERFFGELDKAHVEPDKIMNEATRVAAEIKTGAIEERLSSSGYRRVYGTNGAVWFPPGVDSVQWIFDNSNRDILEELLERAASRALAKMAATEQADSTALMGERSTSEQSKGEPS